jgi:hypothetical protein
MSVNAVEKALTNYVEQTRSWQDDSRSAGQEIPRLLQNQMVNFRACKRPLGESEFRWIQIILGWTHAAVTSWKLQRTNTCGGGGGDYTDM